MIDALQQVLAAGVALGLDKDNDLDRLDRQQRSRLPLVTGLPTRPPPTGPPAGTLPPLSR
jgi:hypothetical protein